MTNKFFKKIKAIRSSEPLQSRGFTLMETLVAVLVLSLAITGPLTMAERGLRAALTAKDQTVAFYLAQDAIEFVRYARDTNCLVAGASATGCPPAVWITGNANPAQTISLAPCVSSSGTAACTIDVIAGSAPAGCVGGVCSVINYDAARNYFTYGSGTASPFTRTVSITSPVCNAGATVCNANEVLVSVKVTWSDPVNHTVIVKESLLDWQ